MENKFEFKDLMNNVISGILWETSILMIVFLCKPEVIAQIAIEKISEFTAVLFTLLIILAFILGIILRGFEQPFICFYKCLFGTPYNKALKVIDDKAHEDKIKRTKCKYACWFIHCLLKCIKKKLSLKHRRIGFANSEIIIEKLQKLKIYPPPNSPLTSTESNQSILAENYDHSLTDAGIMAERYLIINKIEGPYLRFKDLKNFFESVSFPLFLSLVLAKWTLFDSMNCCLYFFLVVVFYILFLLRYDYYYRNYVKDIFRLMFFAAV